MFVTTLQLYERRGSQFCELLVNSLSSTVKTETDKIIFYFVKDHVLFMAQWTDTQFVVPWWSISRRGGGALPLMCGLNLKKKEKKKEAK